MNKKKALSSGELYRKYGIVIIMIILFVASAVINHNFLKPQNLLNILKQISVVTIIACGETMLIVSGLICQQVSCVRHQPVYRPEFLHQQDIYHWLF